MAQISPFRAYRYTDLAGPLPQLVTQPYDKITTEMQARYLEANPHNIVRILLGERYPDDHEGDNVYTRAADYFAKWIRAGILAQDPEPGFYAYYQEFTPPDSPPLVRKGFIGLGAVEEYSAGVVYPHERTLSGPKKDRLELLAHTRAHFGQIFMLYSDPALLVDSWLDEAAAGRPLCEVTDEYGTLHRMWKIGSVDHANRIQQAMADQRLLIADGHHRYETALAFRREHPQIADAARVMMTFVNMRSPGLKILATHRVVRGLATFSAPEFQARLPALEPLPSLDALRVCFATPAPDLIRIGIAFSGDPDVYLLQRPRKPGEIDVRVLHDELLGGALGIGETEVREQRYLHYVRGLEAAYSEVREGPAQIAFLLEPVTIDQVAETAFGGGVMPQKSTDFYPKLLSGLAIYKLER